LTIPAIRTIGLLAVLTSVLTACESDTAPKSEGLAQFITAQTGYNVLVVSFDAMRADALGIYGYDRETSPHIDAFADRSIVFDNAYTAAPVTPTSFAASFSGQYPFRVFIGWQLRPTLTLAGTMKNAGYSTFGVFNNVQLAPERRYDQGFDAFTAGITRDENILVGAEQLLEQNRNRKFFGWIHFISPHTPYQYRKMSAHLAPKLDEGRFAQSTGGHFEIESEQELARVRDLYDGEVFYADDLFGRLLQTLQDLGLDERTIVVLTADHGEEFMDHGQLQHNSMFQEVVRIPMILHHPALTQGVRTDLPYVNIDLLPTLTALVGIEPPVTVDGVNLLQGTDPSRPRVVTGMTNKERYEIMIEQSGKKLIQQCTPEFHESLYDLDADPGEHDDIVLDRPDLAGELFAELERIVMGEPCRVITDSSRGKSPRQLLDDEQIEQLKSLGYIQ
jgi:arylsulfatase A-like enzyme